MLISLNVLKMISVCVSSSADCKQLHDSASSCGLAVLVYRRVPCYRTPSLSHPLLCMVLIPGGTLDIPRPPPPIKAPLVMVFSKVKRLSPGCAFIRVIRYTPVHSMGRRLMSVSCCELVSEGERSPPKNLGILRSIRQTYSYE